MKFRNRVGRFLPEVAVANQCRQPQRARQTNGRCFTNAGYNTHILRSLDRLLIEVTSLEIKFDSLLSFWGFGTSSAYSATRENGPQFARCAKLGHAFCTLDLLQGFPGFTRLLPRLCVSAEHHWSQRNLMQALSRSPSTPAARKN